MDIEEFYAADERRRASEELEYGREWRDRSGVRYEVSWVVDTGELYVMREPVAGVVEDPFGDIWALSEPTEAVTVGVVGTVPDRATLDAALSGWQEEMVRPDSVRWLAGRLSDAGIRVHQDGIPD